MFFDFVMKHWMVLLFGVIYVAFFSLPAALMLKKVAPRCKPLKRLVLSVDLLVRRGYSSTSILHRATGILALCLGLMIISSTFVLVLVFFPFLLVVDRILLAREERRLAECDRRAEEERQEERQKMREQNAERYARRRDWLQNNPPVLYYNTMGGVVAVLNAAMYRSVQKATEQRRTDEFWEHGSVLLPSPETKVFVTKRGLATLDAAEAALGLDDLHRYYMSGMLSELHELAERGAILVEKKDIFVPWVSEGILPFAQQMKVLRSCYDGWERALLEGHVPAELRPLPE